MIGITPSQRRVLDFIVKHQRMFQMPPTRQEIAHELGFSSPNAAEEHLKALQRKGFINLIPRTARGIRVLEVA